MINHQKSTCRIFVENQRAGGSYMQRQRNKVICLLSNCTESSRSVFRISKFQISIYPVKGLTGHQHKIAQNQSFQPTISKVIFDGIKCREICQYRLNEKL